MGNATIMQPPTKLASKVRRSQPLDVEKAIAKADAIVANVAAEFEEGLSEEFTELDRLLTAYKESKSDYDLDQLFKRIHNLRGQGTTLGYPLISRIGSSFCRYMIERDSSKAPRLAVIEQHLAALRCVFQQGIGDSGDKLCQQVVAALDMVVEKELAA